ncbi:hypothetical protein [Colwellia sp. RSH04]|uniref:COG4648 family protein n=1 Tax=Colwellia sp. RSH04 TaxID=2305464 RepID=UPI000E597FA7|nr:hypothetical protein [Colwellia sp. RSH04]RHW75788.1 hypothetical protein D1094_11760 [Colwellia sp. RSH04]
MKIILTLISILYPLVVFYGLAEFSVRWVSLILLLLFLTRLLLLKKSNTLEKQNKQLLSDKASKIITIWVASFLLMSFIFGNDTGLLFYPVIINAALALVFSYSLANPPPVIERLARLTQAELPPHAIAYTRKVTKVWLGFFIINAIIACYTALFTSLATWTLYNGLIAYILMGVLFTTEYLVRLRVQKLNDN